MADLEPLAVGSEHYRVIPHDIATAHGGEADGLALAWAGLTLTAIDRHGVKIPPQRLILKEPAGGEALSSVW